MKSKFRARFLPEVAPILPRLYLPSLERDEYVAGWRWGFFCGAVATALVTAIALLVH